jgi:hypothetical protein
MATERLGFTDREMRDAEYWRLKEAGIKGINRYTTHSDLPETGETIPDKWKGWSSSIIYVVAWPVETLPPIVEEAEAAAQEAAIAAAKAAEGEVPAENDTEVPLTETGSSDMMNEGGNTNELGKQSIDSIPTRFRGRVELAKPSDDSSERPDSPTDEDVL